MKIKNKLKILYGFIFFILFFSFFIIKYIINSPKYINLDYFFKNLLYKNKVKKIIVNNKRYLYIQLYNKYLKNNFFKTPESFHFFSDIGDLQLFKKKFNFFQQKYNIKSNLYFNNTSYLNLYKFLFNNSFFILIFIIISLFIIIIKKVFSNIFNITKSKDKLFNKNENIKIKFKDVAGLLSAKEEIKEVVDFLKNKKKYIYLGGKIPKGILLIGPPGTGKTLLAKAVAGEANVPFFYLSGSDFIEMFVGVGASRVRNLFNKAKKKSPSIIFIDEIDAIGKSRSTKNFINYNDERENTLNKLLTEMDGFNTNTNVIVIAATNRAEILDKALLRPGRFDRRIIIELPNKIERKEIFKLYLKKLVLSKRIDINSLAQQSYGLSGADISNICNEAALIAARKNKKKIYNKDFIDSMDRIFLGLEIKNKILNKEEKKRIAYHESGHALVNYILNKNQKLVKISIIPRGNSLGSTLYLPDERQMTIENQIKNEICVLLSGRASEYIVFKNISTGALKDLEISTKKAFNMVINYGFSSLGNISYYNFDIDNFKKPYSEKTAYKIDKEIFKIIKNEYNRAQKILYNNIKKLHIISKNLLKKEVLFKKDIDKIMKI
ncbi:MAG: ATP-dependent zinc metalloprotease FtsH [Candidatus Shikimatogenerans bostrichidophilus]|nr:MAG: ATP-dependent zinc metalloprotease FtsH [Candidatus Shikimatogenerans bostrichidophilus]